MLSGPSTSSRRLWTRRVVSKACDDHHPQCLHKRTSNAQGVEAIVEGVPLSTDGFGQPFPLPTPANPAATSAQSNVTNSGVRVKEEPTVWMTWKRSLRSKSASIVIDLDVVLLHTQGNAWSSRV
eukprot:2332960-Amphidinium_carterae.2